MPNSFYNHGTAPVANSSPLSSSIRDEFDLITSAFSLCPTLTGNAGKAVVVNAAGTALVVTTGTLALAGNLITTGAFTTTFAQRATVTVTLPATNGTLSHMGVRRGMLWGLTLSNGTDTVNDLNVAAGSCASIDTLDSNVVMMTLASIVTKQLDATWVTGTNQGGRSSSLALSSTTWHVFVIRVAGVDDVGYDTSGTGANLIADHGATNVRRVGSIWRSSLPSFAIFTQINDTFLLTVKPQEALVNPGTALFGTTQSFVPLGVTTGSIRNIITLAVIDTAPAGTVFARAVDGGVVDAVPTEINSQLVTSTAKNRTCSGRILVSTFTAGSENIAMRLSASNANITLVVTWEGWTDSRGKDY